MSLISCPKCGKQISEKAEQCPHCGLKVELENYQNSVFEDSKPEPLNKGECQLDVEYVEKGKIKKNKKKLFFIILIVVLLVVGIGGYIIYSKLSENPLLFMDDREKINQYIPQLVGEMDETHTIQIPAELGSIIENGLELFGVDGVLKGSHTTEGDEKGIADIVIWTSKDECGETELSNAEDILAQIYGPAIEGDSNTVLLDQVIPTCVQWNSNRYNLIICGLDNEQKLTVAWYANISDKESNKKEEDTDEEIGRIDDYKGIFSEEAKEYQTIAESLFLEKLEEYKKGVIANGGDPETSFNWSLIGSSEKNKKYYYLYTYTDSDGQSIDLHTLIAVDPNSMEAEDVTPLQWLDDEIQQLDDISS